LASPAPLISGASGGTFSSTDGLEIDPISGIIKPGNSAAGTYTITYTLPGCPNFTTSATITIDNTLPGPQANFSYIQSESIVYGIDFTSTSTNAVQYLWDFGNVDTSSSANPSYTFPLEGTYQVTLIVSSDCGADTISLDVLVIKTGFAELQGFEQLTLFPNPGNQFVQISGKSLQPQEISIRLMGIEGKILQVKQFSCHGKFAVDLNCETLSRGIYIIEVYSASGVKALRWVKY
jgi:hypothetical protein